MKQKFHIYIYIYIGYRMRISHIYRIQNENFIYIKQEFHIYKIRISYI